MKLTSALFIIFCTINNCLGMDDLSGAPQDQQEQEQNLVNPERYKEKEPSDVMSILNTLCCPCILALTCCASCTTPCKSEKK